MGHIQALCACLIWGAISPLLVRYIPLPAPTITLLGNAVGAAIMLAAVKRTGRREIVRAFLDHGPRLALNATFFVGCSLTFHWSIKATTLANAEITHACQALITCLVLMPLAGHGRAAPRDLLPLGLGLAGLWIAMPPDLLRAGHGPGILMGLVSAVFYALLNVHVPYFQGKLRPEILQACNLVAVTAALPFVAVGHWIATGSAPTLPALDPSGLAALVALGAFNFILANLLFIRALRTAPISHVAIIGYTEPVIGIAAGAVVLGEAASWQTMGGGALVLASSALVMAWRKSA